MYQLESHYILYLSGKKQHYFKIIDFRPTFLGICNISYVAKKSIGFKLSNCSSFISYTSLIKTVYILYSTLGYIMTRICRTDR